MRKSDSSFVSFGIRIRLGTLVNQITLENFEKIKHMIVKEDGGFLEDENGLLNDLFFNIVRDVSEINDYITFKETLIHKFRTHEIISDWDVCNSLQDKNFLFMEDVLIGSRKSHDWHGTSGVSASFDPNIVKQLQQRCNFLQDFEIVLILQRTIL